MVFDSPLTLIITIPTRPATDSSSPLDSLLTLSYLSINNNKILISCISLPNIDSLACDSRVGFLSVQYGDRSPPTYIGRFVLLSVRYGRRGKFVQTMMACWISQWIKQCVMYIGVIPLRINVFWGKQNESALAQETLRENIAETNIRRTVWKKIENIIIHHHGRPSKVIVKLSPRLWRIH